MKLPNVWEFPNFLRSTTCSGKNFSSYSLQSLTDKNGHYRAQLLYDAITGKRVKEPFSHMANLNIEKCRILMGRKVILFPDLDGFEKWSTKAKELRDRMPGTSIEVSDLLETHASEDERSSGLDIADYLLRYDWRVFREETIPPSTERIKEDSKSEKGENCEPS